MDHDGCSEQNHIRDKFGTIRLYQSGRELIASLGISDHFDLPIEKSSSSGKEQEDGWISGRFSLSILTIFSLCENWTIYNFTKMTTLLLCGFTTSENGCYVRFPVYLIYCWFWEVTIIRAS